MNNQLQSTEKKYQLWINIVSVAIPVVVAFLFMVRIPNVEPLSFLPPIYASINGITAILLVMALVAIKNKKIVLHENLMKTAIACSFLFLVMYVAYHMTSDSTKFGDINSDGVRSEIEAAKLGASLYIYQFILLSHILLSIIVIPLVLISYVRAKLEKYELHKKIVKFAFPIWLYVAVTGVIVYLMISPYYI
jgi:putative membrane protein